jgi:hypothetical protein
MATTDRIEEALAALEFQELPNRIAEEYGVDGTRLSRHHRGICTSIQEAREFQRLLSTQQETALVKHINRLSEAGIPTPWIAC